jgi:hypothetical protein
MVHIKRQENRVLIFDYEGRNPIVLDHDETVDLANRLLDAAGHMRQEQDEEANAL